MQWLRPRLRGRRAALLRSGQDSRRSFLLSTSGVLTAAFLKSLDQTPFFESMRMLTMLGMFAAPKYAGNYAGAGWKLLGFEWRFHEIDFH